MLNVELAEKFIEKIVIYTDYNINIMNDKGIIVASRDRARVGTFHEIAYQIIKEDKNVIEVEMDNAYLGTKNGVNMAFFHKNIRIGVVGVTGVPDKVREIAMIIRMSLETMFEYEMVQEKIYQRKGTKEYFINCLIHNEENEKELNELCQMLGYNSQLVRIPILIQFESEVDLESLLYKIKQSHEHSKQDISSITRDKQIIIFKIMDCGYESIYKNYKTIIEDYLTPLLNYIREKELMCHFYVGSAQNKMENYGISYRHCKWVKTLKNSNNVGIYFYDYVGKFFRSRIPFIEMHHVYNIFGDILDERVKKNIVEIIESMTNNNYNLIETSKELFIHRNTLVFRLNKIKEYFNINPIQNYYDREFLGYLCYYLKKIEK